MSHSRPEISVIVPAYKVANYLPDCVGSILAETFSDFELILVDDGSPDRTPELCDRLASTDSRIRVIHKQNQGLGMARNTGLEAARGEWIVFIDGDDTVDPRLLERGVTIAYSNPSLDMVRFVMQRFATTSPAPIQFPSGAPSFHTVNAPVAFHPILNFISPGTASLRSVTTNASSCGCLYRRSVFIDHNLRFPSERALISEDYVFNIDFAAHCRAIAFSAYPLYHYRHNPASLSTAVRADRTERTAEMCEHLERRGRELGLDRPDLFGMGAMFGPLRAQLRHIFGSNLPASEKRELFRRSISHPYIARIRREYPLHTLPLMQRIIFTLHTAGLYTPCRILTTLRDRTK